MGGIRSTEDIARLRLFRSAGIGPAKFFQFIDTYGSAEDAIEEINAGAHNQKLCSPDQVEQEVAAIENSGGQLIFWTDDTYSHLLRQTVNPPPILCAYGQPHLMQRPTIGIVGARNASAAGKRFTTDLANDLAHKGYVVVSGLARGIDTAAHQGASPENTIAVMAGGIDVTYPPENADLHQQIAEKGLVISEMPFSFRPKAEHFPRRNRVVSGVSLGIVVIEAAERSGALITARLAGEQGRDVFAVPGSPLDPRSSGTNALIRQGATLVRSAEDILESLHEQPALFAQIEKKPVAPKREPSNAAAKPVTRADTASNKSREIPDADRILSCLSHTAVEVDEIVRQTNIKAGDLLGLLIELELDGKCKLHPGQKVTLS